MEFTESDDWTQISRQNSIGEFPQNSIDNSRQNSFDEFVNISSNKIMPTYNFNKKKEDIVENDNIHRINENSTQSTIVISISAHGNVINENLPDELSNNVIMFSYAAPNTVLCMDEPDFKNYIETIEFELNRKNKIMSVIKGVRDEFTDENTPLNKKITADHNNVQKNVPDGEYIMLDNPHREIQNKHIANIYNPQINMQFESDPFIKSTLSTGEKNPYWIGCNIEVLDVRYPKSRNQYLAYNRENSALKYRNPTSKFIHNIFDEIVTYGEKITIKLSSILKLLKEKYNFDYVFIVMAACRTNEFNTANTKQNSTYAETNAQMARYFELQTERFAQMPDRDIIAILGGKTRRRRRHLRRCRTTHPRLKRKTRRLQSYRHKNKTRRHQRRHQRRHHPHSIKINIH